MEFYKQKILIYLTLIIITAALGQKTVCPPPDTILPCICTHRQDDVQIWCTHSDLPQVLKGVQRIGEYIRNPIDEVIIENNYLPSLPGKLFQNVKILRLMIRHNGLERVSATWLESQEPHLLEIFIVENDLRSLPSESLMKLQNLQALTIQSHNLKRIPTLVNMQRLRYVNIQSASLSSINEHSIGNLPNLEKLFIKGSLNLNTIKENAFYDMPKLKKLEITECGIRSIHMRALSLLPQLNELSLSNNRISDATMIGRATRDLPMLSTLNLNFNLISKLSEGAFVDQTMLEILYLSNNNINIIHHGAFHRVPKLRVIDLNYNEIVRIHPESFLQQSGSGVEEFSLIGNKIMHISEFRSLLDALPRLRYLDMSDNLLQEIPRGALRGHPSLERLHLNRNNIKFIDADAFIAMPALRELHLSNNSLNDMNEGPFWNLPALKGLDLSNNYFQRLQPKLLYNLPALRRIDISNNQLTIIDPITFMETPLLEYINISGNALISTHPATFRNLPNLYELDASSNRLVEFLPGLPRGLEQLYLRRNQITSLPMLPSPDLDLPSLRTLDLSNNGIQKIQYGGMKTLHNLRRFYINRNGLRQIEASTFSDLERLEVLDISDNQIITIHPKSFIKLPYLKQVNLHGNNVENFDFMAIQNNIALSELDFSKNKLKSISPNIISRGLDVEILNISSNNLHELPNSLNVLSKLKTLDASNNYIKNFDGNIINNIQTLAEIKLHSNRITELRTGSFRDLNNLESIDLENNQLEIIHPMAIANLPKLLSIYLNRNHIIEIPDRAFSNLSKLRIIEMQSNRLQYISIRAFENLPLVQYLNLSNNQLINLDNLGIKHLVSLEVLDLSFNKITRINKESFQYMEWLVELNLDNNLICHISNQPFDNMPRLKVLSLRHNKLTSVFEDNFAKLRNNIAILDIDGNPLVCNCAIIWLKSWLSESSSLGPKCADGSYVKGMPFSKTDCLNVQFKNQDLKSCMTYENEALLPSLATSEVYSSLDKIKDYETHIKNNYQGNKLNNRPLPEESEYFYDDYVDYPYNETLLENMNTAVNQSTKSHNHLGNTPTIYAAMSNTTHKKTGIALKVPVPSSGFTFFGVPLPSIDMGKLLNTGRKIDWSDNKNSQQHLKKYQVTEPPRFETGGFSPMLPVTTNGFIPIPDPTISTLHTTKTSMEGNAASFNNEKFNHNVVSVDNIPPTTTSKNSTTHKKMKSEIHELEAFHGDDNSTHVTYNRTKNIEEQNTDPLNISKYNLMESNLTISQATEKEGIITTDTSNDMSIQGWLETSTVTAAPTIVTTKPLPQINKYIESQPTALSAILLPNNDDLTKNHSRTATVTKVNLPHAEHYDLRYNYSPVINREGKTRFSEESSNNNKPRQVDNNDWYYKNYNKSNLESYIAPGIQSSLGCNIMVDHITLKYTAMLCLILIIY
ncbi:protein artichoke-like [Vanessa cardui]|uniref:protein artichoke-like n=1 Tax=Vanessa cardui TaxID=171605 RepID=UPI001F142645|nr:protein artichoke-like [Vanessa cardui]XP_046961651.1 protein artichoke-like [Vanessa cardui]